MDRIEKHILIGERLQSNHMCVNLLLRVHNSSLTVTTSSDGWEMIFQAAISAPQHITRKDSQKALDFRSLYNPFLENTGDRQNNCVFISLFG